MSHIRWMLATPTETQAPCRKRYSSSRRQRHIPRRRLSTPCSNSPYLNVIERDRAERKRPTKTTTLGRDTPQDTTRNRNTNHATPHGVCRDRSNMTPISVSEPTTFDALGFAAQALSSPRSLAAV